MGSAECPEPESLMAGTPTDLKARTKAFSVRIVRLVDSLPRRRSCEVIGHQLLKSATSVGANYRSACRGRSRAEFMAKMGIVEEESDESAFWMELLVEAGVVKEQMLAELIREANEITAMTVASIKTARAKAKAARAAKAGAV
jgi:four helix bundle protein